MSVAGQMRIADASGSGADGGFDPSNISGKGAAHNARAGLFVLLAVITSVFFLTILAFLIRSQFTDWEPLSAPWQLWINTTMLFMASIALQWARVASRKGRMRTVRETLLVGGVLSFGFLAGQLWVWWQFTGAGYFASSNPANAFFYLLTGLHGLHLLGGLVAWARVMFRPLQKSGTAIALCAMYWHYLLALWLVLFALLTASPESFAAFAALCGFESI